MSNYDDLRKKNEQKKKQEQEQKKNDKQNLPPCKRCGKPGCFPKKCPMPPRPGEK